MARAGPPKCAQCGVIDAAELEDSDLLTVWAEYDGIKWRWHHNLAYWYLCLECHQKIGQRISESGTDILAPVLYEITVLGVRVKVSLICGDLWLMQAPPEF